MKHHCQVGGAFGHTYKERFANLKSTLREAPDETTSPLPKEAKLIEAKLVMIKLVHNTNAVSKTADLDLYGDESTWGFTGYVENESGLHSVHATICKPKVSRGGQFFNVFDAYCFCPRAIVHRHKLNHRPPGFIQEEPEQSSDDCRSPRVNDL